MLSPDPCGLGGLPEAWVSPRVILKSALLLRDRRWAWSEDKVARETKPQIPLFFLGILDGRKSKEVF